MRTTKRKATTMSAIERALSPHSSFAESERAMDPVPLVAGRAVHARLGSAFKRARVVLLRKVMVMLR